MRLARFALSFAFALSVLAISAPGVQAKQICTYRNSIVSDGQTFAGATCHNEQAGKKCACSYVKCQNMAPASYCIPLVPLEKP